MKSLRLPVLFALGLSSVATALHAQSSPAAINPSTVDFIVVNRQATYNQIDATTLTPDSVQPFKFTVAVEGTNMTGTNPLTGASFTWPGGSSTPLTFDAQDNNRWHFANANFASMAALNTAYGTGNYDVTLAGTPSGTVTIPVASFAGTQLQIPQLTLTGGTWVGNLYVLTDTASLTVAFNAVYTGTVTSTQSFHYDAWISGGGNENSGPTGFINYDPTLNTGVAGGATPLAWNAGTLSWGMYTLEVSYNDVQNPASAFGSAFAVSLLEYRTTLAIAVVPEPSTYVSLALGLGLIGTFTYWRRRRA